MKMPKTSARRGLSLRVIFAIVFILFGILVFTELFELGLIRGNDVIINILKYGTALGSLIGGFSMLFRKKEISDIKAPDIKI